MCMLSLLTIIKLSTLIMSLVMHLTTNWDQWQVANCDHISDQKHQESAYFDNPSLSQLKNYIYTHICNIKKDHYIYYSKWIKNNYIYIDSWDYHFIAILTITFWLDLILTK